jgi:drug/metabolite transporter (DMT)-like permease
MNDTSKRHQLWIFLNFGLVYLFWGSTYLAIRVAVTEHIPPTMMGALRFTIAGGVMLLVCAAFGKKVILSPYVLFRIGIIGVLLLTTGNVVLGWAEQYVPSGFAALLLATTPLWIAIIENVILKGERLEMRGIYGLLLATLGLGILMWPRLMTEENTPDGFWLAAGGLMIAAISWAIGSVCSRRWDIKADPFAMTAWEMFLAGLVNFAIALVLGDHQRMVWTNNGVSALIYLIIAGSWIGFTAYVWLLKNVPTAKAATYAYVNPIVAVFLGWLILGEGVDAFVFVGAAVTIMSVWLVNSSKIK